MSANSDFDDLTMNFSFDDNFDEYDDDKFDDDFNDYEDDDQQLDKFDDEAELYFDDVFKDDDYDEPYDDQEDEDGYRNYKRSFDEEDWFFINNSSSDKSSFNFILIYQLLK